MCFFSFIEEFKWKLYLYWKSVGINQCDFQTNIDIKENQTKRALFDHLRTIQSGCKRKFCFIVLKRFKFEKDRKTKVYKLCLNAQIIAHWLWKNQCKFMVFICLLQKESPNSFRSVSFSWKTRKFVWNKTSKLPPSIVFAVYPEHWD